MSYQGESHLLLYRELVEDPLCGWFGFSAAELCSFWSWAPMADSISNPEISLTLRLVWNGLSVNDVAVRWGLVNLSDCHQCDPGLEERPSHAVYHCPQVGPFWDYVGDLTARIAP